MFKKLIAITTTLAIVATSALAISGVRYDPMDFDVESVENVNGYLRFDINDGPCTTNPDDLFLHVINTNQIPVGVQVDRKTSDEVFISVSADNMYAEAWKLTKKGDVVEACLASIIQKGSNI